MTQRRPPVPRGQRQGTARLLPCIAPPKHEPLLLRVNRQHLMRDPTTRRYRPARFCGPSVTQRGWRADVPGR